MIQMTFNKLEGGHFEGSRILMTVSCSNQRVANRGEYFQSVVSIRLKNKSRKGYYE